MAFACSCRLAADLAQVLETLRKLPSQRNGASPAVPCSRCPELSRRCHELQGELAVRGAELAEARAQAAELLERQEQLRSALSQTHEALGAQVGGLCLCLISPLCTTLRVLFLLCEKAATGNSHDKV